MSAPGGGLLAGAVEWLDELYKREQQLQQQ